MIIYKIFRKIFKLEFFFVAFFVMLILLPLFRRGYIFAYDELFIYPKIIFKLHNLIPNHTYLLFLLDKVNYLIPTWVIQKIIWFLALFIGGIGAYKMIDSDKEQIKYVAGIFYVFNPFVYERMVMGQVMIIMGYSLLPFVVIFIRKLAKSHEFKYLIYLSIISGLAVLFSVHYIFIYALLVFLYFSIHAISQRKYQRFILYFIFFILIVFVINSSWIISEINRDKGIGNLTNDFGEGDIEFYLTSKELTGNVFLNALSMNGFWAERGDFFRLILTSSVSIISFIIIFSIIIYGMITSFTKDALGGIKKKEAIFFATLLFIGILLSVGQASQITNFFSKILYDYVPFYKGMREPQKWISMLVLAYMFFLSVAAEKIKSILNTRKTKLLFAALLILLPIIYSHNMLWGFGGQLRVSDYPVGWYDINNYLNEQKKTTGDFKAIFLPWSFYPELSFAGSRSIINPSLGFFDTVMHIGDDTMVGNTYSQKYYRENKLIEEVFVNNLKNCNIDGYHLKKKFKELEIKYIIVAVEENTKNDIACIKRTDFFNLEKKYAEIELYGLETN